MSKGGSGASEAWREATESARRPPRAESAEPWVLIEEIHDEAEHAVQRGRSAGVPRETAKEVAARDRREKARREQLGRAVGSDRAPRVEKKLREAARDFEAEHFADAARTLKPLSEQAPSVAAVRELYGLTLYRQRRWRLAVKELEAFRTLSGSTEQHPVLADCYRALRQWRHVDELWDEVRHSSPSGEIVTEGRIVTAGALADRGDTSGAIRLLEQGWRFPKRPKPHHLRRAYALADLYERAGEISRARELFGRIRSSDPSFADVPARLRALR